MMARVVVYRVRMYDINTGKFIISRRMATEEGARGMGGTVVEGTGVEIDTSELALGEEYTPIDYAPQSGTGSQASE